MATDIDEETVLRNKTIIAHVAPCPPAAPICIHVMISGEDTMNIKVQRPTYFDNLCTVTVNEISEPTKVDFAIRSAKDIARKAVRCARNFQADQGSPVSFDRPVLDTRKTSPRNVAHLLITIIPLCLYARKHFGDDIVFIFDHLGSYRICHSLMAAFGMLPTQTHRKIEGPIIHIRGTRGLAAYDLIDTFDCPILSFLPQTFDEYDFGGGANYEKIFLARKDARSIVNQSEVERLTTARGYRTVYMEDHSLADQMSIGANAKKVIAIHGAGMAFLSLSKNIDSVIEISPPHVLKVFFAVALENIVKKYVFLVQGFDERVMHTGWDTTLRFMSKPFSVDVDQLKQAIDSVE